MRNYDYQDKWKALLTPRVVRNLMVIHEYRGEQRIIVGRHADVLENFVEVAKMQSAESSNRMEGIQTSDERLKKIMLNKTMPKNRMEREIAGYRDVLNMIQRFPACPRARPYISRNVDSCKKSFIRANGLLRA